MLSETLPNKPIPFPHAFREYEIFFAGDNPIDRPCNTHPLYIKGNRSKGRIFNSGMVESPAAVGWAEGAIMQHYASWFLHAIQAQCE
jgi:hypothetical protein